MAFRDPRTSCAAAIAILMTAAVARADVHTVTTAEDGLVQGVPVEGSLRHTLKFLAKPGDTIRFSSNFVIVMESPSFDVPEGLTGLRIEGPVQLRRDGDSGRFDVRASGVVVDGVSFRNVIVQARGGTGPVLSGIEVRNCGFAARGRVDLENVDACVVEDCTIEIDKRPRDDSAGIQASGVVASRISRNRVTVVGGRGRAIALSDFSGTVEGNIVPAGDVSAEGASIVVRGNDVVTGAISASAVGVQQDGPFEVRGNRSITMLVAAVDVTVADNVVGAAAMAADGKRALPRGPAALRAIGYELANPTHTGPVVISGNHVSGGSSGTLHCSTGSASTSVTVSDNEVSDVTSFGIVVSTTTPTSVLRNTVTGSDRGFAGVQVLRSAAGSGTRIEGCEISRIGVFGIEIRPAARATLVGNTVSGCGGTGVLVGKGGFASSSRDHSIGNGGDGFGFLRRATGSVSDGTVTGNDGAGVWVDKASLVEVRRTSFASNGGPGIDIFPRRVTPDARKLKGNRSLGWPSELAFDEAKRGVEGKAVPGSVIEVFRVEEGARAGNPMNGEGAVFLAAGVADQDGKFSVPVACDEGDRLTVTATLGSPRVSSEFSDDVICRAGPAIDLVSIASAGGAADERSSLESFAARAISADGRFVVFSSMASNLVAGDTNGRSDVFLRDRMAGTTRRVSLDSAGAEIVPEFPDFIVTEGASTGGSVSDDGRYVVFSSYANRVVPGDTQNLEVHVYLHDVVAGTTTAVSEPVDHSSGYDASISGDGRFVAFVTRESDWDPDDRNGTSDVFVWERASGAVTLVSRTTGGLPSGETFNSSAQSPRLSSDGRYVVFCTAHTLTPGDTVAGLKVFVRDRELGTTELVSRTSDGAPAAGSQPSISADGRYVSFATTTALVAADTNGVSDVYVRDRDSGTITLASLDTAGAPFAGAAASGALSGDGRRLAFVAPGGHAGEFITELFNDVYVRDLTVGVTIEGAIGPSGDSDGVGASPSLSGDGRHLVFASNGSNLVPGDAPFLFDIFVRTLPDAP